MAPTRQCVTRRQCLKTIGVTAGVAASVPYSWKPLLAFADEPQPTPSEAELPAMEETVRAFMHRYEVPGFSVAIAQHGQFVYRRAFGWADQEAGERATPANVFRIGSVSKPITSVAIFTLIERKRLKLNDFVFGPNGVLGFDYGTRFLVKAPLSRFPKLLPVETPAIESGLSCLNTPTAPRHLTAHLYRPLSE
jgi:Beta-lactamase